jgi:hypothetical protein
VGVLKQYPVNLGAQELVPMLNHAVLDPGIARNQAEEQIVVEAKLACFAHDCTFLSLSRLGH